MNVTDRTVIVTDRTIIVTDRMVIVTDRTIIVTDRMVIVTDRTVIVTDRTIDVTDRTIAKVRMSPFSFPFRSTDEGPRLLSDQQRIGKTGCYYGQPRAAGAARTTT